MAGKLSATDIAEDPQVIALNDAAEHLQSFIFPFPARLSFAPLIRRIEQQVAGQKNYADSLLGQEVLRRLKAAPELGRPIDDMRILEAHPDAVELLLNCIISAIDRDTQLAKVAIPFQFNALYATPALKRMMQNSKVNYLMGTSPEMFYSGVVIGACIMILSKFYGLNLEVEPPISMLAEKSDSALTRHYKTELDLQFLDIIPLKPLPPLSQEQINRLLGNIYDIDLWLQCLPPDHFEFQGIIVHYLHDITEVEALSQLKYYLLRQDAIVGNANIRELERLLRMFFKLPELRLGLTTIDYPPDKTRSRCYNIRFDFLAGRQQNLLADENQNSIYDKVCKYKEVLLVEDLDTLHRKTPIEKDLIDVGIRSIIVAPLFDKKERLIGLMEIGTPQPYQLHSFIEVKFRDVIPLFSLAVERSREEIDNQIEAIIREQFTSVHPSIEWRFREAASNLLTKREQNEGMATMEPIVFQDVYPLYGQSDIVSSSDKRNAAILADLLDNLNRVRKVLLKCMEHIRFPLLNQFLMKVNRNIEQLEREFTSSDESRIIDLLHLEVHPLLENLRSDYPDLAGVIVGYFNHLDPALGIVHRKRKAYEDSVAMLNNMISSYIEQQELESQKITPHYFEKYKTDGVEYEIYAGQSLLRQGKFCMMHLKNLRLWQLIHMCEITRRVNDLKSSLPVPLDTAQLVFVFNSPLSIRFRMDEKQFDVDGSYNVRYEILKKRIDKAMIDGVEERLTVAGKIAIVYLQDKDRQEYLEYIDYLQHEGYITAEVEDLMLAKLQSVQGLRALRITVKAV